MQNQPGSWKVMGLVAASAAAMLGAGPALAEETGTWIALHTSDLAQPPGIILHVSFVSREAVFTNDLRLVDPESAAIFICDQGAPSKDLGPYPTGTTARFSISNQDGTFYSGSRSGQSSDGLQHFHLFQNAADPNLYQFRVEDMFNLGDQDFNDCVYNVRLTDAVERRA